jgi:hypothetical protein
MAWISAACALAAAAEATVVAANDALCSLVGRPAEREEDPPPTPEELLMTETPEDA